MLNEHYAAMDLAISQHQGMINKFMGDGFLAVFGVPVPEEHPCAKALVCALEMISANRQLNQVRQNRGDQPVELGIGLHYGGVIAGNIGTVNRMEYTVIGDTVNLASRIQGLSSKVGSPIVCSTGFVSRFQNGEEPLPQPAPQLMRLGTARVKGKAEPVEIWAPVP